MIDQGDVAVADLNLERRHAVLVLSNRRFHRITGRALVAPAEANEPFPWRIRHDSACFAVDLARTVSLANLGDAIETISVAGQRQATQALRFITA